MEMYNLPPAPILRGEDPKIITVQQRNMTDLLKGKAIAG